MAINREAQHILTIGILKYLNVGAGDVTANPGVSDPVPWPVHVPKPSFSGL